MFCVSGMSLDGIVRDFIWFKFFAVHILFSYWKLILNPTESKLTTFCNKFHHQWPLMARSVCLQIIMRIHTTTKSDILSCCLVVRYWSLNQRLCCVIHTMLLWKTVLWRESSCYLVVILVTPWADRAVAGIVMLFGCHTGHAMGGPCCSGNRHAIWLSYWSRHGRTVL